MKIIASAGIDGVVAQGFEAGGHRGLFDPEALDDCLGTLALTRLLVRALDIPVIAAGGIMDGAGIAACLLLARVLPNSARRSSDVWSPKRTRDIGRPCLAPLQSIRP